jgi:YHS domain-containing protein
MKYITFIVFLLLLLSFPSEVLKAEESIASQGYDLVSYQKDNAAIKGSDEYFVKYMGLLFLFSSEENKDLFKETPEKYLPEYGGYCAMGMTLGQKIPVDPEAFTFINGRLYLNLNKGVRQKWLENTAENIKKSNRQWKDIKHADPSASNYAQAE